MSNKVYVVGGGPSIENMDLHVLNTHNTIGINKTIFYLKNPSYFITMDYTVINKLGLNRIQNLSCPRFFVVNLATSCLKVRQGAITDIRNNKTYHEIYSCFDNIILARTENGIGTSLRDFRPGNNSGYCGFQLAVALGYTEIYLVGIDLTTNKGHTHFHDGYKEAYSSFTKRLPNYYSIFSQGISELRNKMPQVQVFSCSPISKLNEIIPFIPLKESLTL